VEIGKFEFEAPPKNLLLFPREGELGGWKLESLSSKSPREPPSLSKRRGLGDEFRNNDQAAAAEIQKTQQLLAEIEQAMR